MIDKLIKFCLDKRLNFSVGSYNNKTSIVVDFLTHYYSADIDDEKELEEVYNCVIEEVNKL